MAEAEDHGFSYEAFGLRFRSDLRLPELSPAAEDARVPDVIIETGPVPARLEGAADLPPGMQVAGRRFQLDVPAARYRVSDGRLIRVDPRPGVAAGEVRLPLLGTVMGALCHQRPQLPLHAGAMLVRGRAVVFAGPTGAGKSTLAARLRSRGRSVLADDLCPVGFDGRGAVSVAAGVGRVRLRSDSPALQELAAHELLTRDAAGRAVLPLARPPDPGPWPLWRLYRLAPGGVGPPRIAPLAGPEAVAAVLAEVYRWPIAVAMTLAPARFAQVVALARACEVFEAAFSHHGDAPDSLVDALERHLDS